MGVAELGEESYVMLDLYLYRQVWSSIAEFKVTIRRRCDA